MEMRMILPTIVLKEMVLLPKNIMNFNMNKPEAVEKLENQMLSNQLIFVAVQNEEGDPDVLEKRLYHTGVIAKIRQISKLPNKSIQVLLEGLERAVIIEAFLLDDGTINSEVERLVNTEETDHYTEEAMKRLLRENFKEYGGYNKASVSLINRQVSETEDLEKLIDLIVANIPLRYTTKQSFLEEASLLKRYDKLMTILTEEVNVAKIRKEINDKIKEKVNKNQKEYILREQLGIIKKELGEDFESDADEFEKKLKSLEASKSVKDKISKEIRRFKAMNNAQTEAFVERNYIETLLELPWDKASLDNIDIENARKILDEDHYGLEKIKERIIEFLAVRALTDKGDAPIICLVGPPGTGKTSIAKSLARAMERKYVRVCLGGVKDEAEIRGHRRTYIGSMPGRIATGLKTAGVKNPVMLLDEIDKISTDPMRDTSAALLEVLDNEQNVAFRDHYVEIPIDLSEVFFIATANSTQTIPKPLLDRMEIVEVNSYTANEKFHIAKDHLVKKQLKKNGLSKKTLSFSDGALNKMIEGYTREAGVRQLERLISKVCRKAAMQILSGECEKVEVKGKNLKDYLGSVKYRKDKRNKKGEVGIVRGLAWTSVGGDTLSIEVNVVPGKGNLELTGQLGDVMKESAKAGLSYIRAIADKYSISKEFFAENDIHIHIPEGAVPKDGPSAGITMATAVLSAVTGIAIKPDVAMTGEITLRGRVLPIGGLKEKLLAAKTAGITMVLVPKENEKDVEEISEEILNGLEIVYVNSMDEVIERAFEEKTV